jgi:predicted PhzF superfamily epimerase YddE/YHI9
MVVLASQKEVENTIPDFKLLATIKARGVMVTAKGASVDFVSRFFAPQSGIDEDPVTGSAHTMLIPYWANKLGKNTFTAQQLSARKGDLWCKLLGDRVEISGKARTYLIGEIETA